MESDPAEQRGAERSTAGGATEHSGATRCAGSGRRWAMVESALLHLLSPCSAVLSLSAVRKDAPYHSAPAASSRGQHSNNERTARSLSAILAFELLRIAPPAQRSRAHHAAWNRSHRRLERHHRPSMRCDAHASQHGADSPHALSSLHAALSADPVRTLIRRTSQREQRRNQRELITRFPPLLSNAAFSDPRSRASAR